MGCACSGTGQSVNALVDVGVEEGGLVDRSAAAKMQWTTACFCQSSLSTICRTEFVIEAACSDASHYDLD